MLTSSVLGPGSYGHYAEDAQVFADAGADFLKVDYCAYDKRNVTGTSAIRVIILVGNSIRRFVQYRAVQCSAVQCSTIQCSAVQYRTVCI